MVFKPKKYFKMDVKIPCLEIKFIKLILDVNLLNCKPNYESYTEMKIFLFSGLKISKFLNSQLGTYKKS